MKFVFKIQEYQVKNRELESQVDDLRKNLEELKTATINLNAELNEKLSFTKSCQ